MASSFYAFSEPTALNSVAEFHDMFELPVLESPSIPDERRCALRVSLLQEELEELKEAIQQNDLVGVADALCDLQYVLSGAVLEFGLANKFKSLFDEVQRSNMSKSCATLEIAKATQKYYLEEKNTPSFIEARDGKYLVYRLSDKKVLKSVAYSEANLQGVLIEGTESI